MRRPGWDPRTKRTPVKGLLSLALAACGGATGPLPGSGARLPPGERVAHVGGDGAFERAITGVVVAPGARVGLGRPLEARTPLRALVTWTGAGPDGGAGHVAVGADETEGPRRTLTPGVPTVLGWTAAAGAQPWLQADLDAGVLHVAPVTTAPDGGRPPRVVVALVDTLRADRLGAWGHDRDTSPHLDALAARGRRFANAVAPAPWTLPSTQALWSGRPPERWSDGETLAERFSAAGWRTAAVVANPWLSDAHGLTRGWDRHELWTNAPADAQVDRALSLLEAHADEPLLLWVHLQDPHLPYREPEPHRSRWAGPPPAGLTEAPTSTQLGALDTLPLDDPRRTWLLDRYDQNVAFVDAELGRLLSALHPDDVVVVAADHGEELWEHGGVEHGHALWQELLHVPLILAGAGIPAGVTEEPVSLEDVGPTLLRLAGLPLDPAEAGRDLIDSDPAGRALVSGRLLYGPAGWSVRQGAAKAWIHDGVAWSTNLDTDPGERAAARMDAAAAEALRAGLSGALGLPAPTALRLTRPGVVPGTSSLPGATLRLSCPDGLSDWWTEPRPLSPRTAPAVSDDALVIGRVPGEVPVGETFVVPRAGSTTCTARLEDPALGAVEADVPWPLAPGAAVILGRPGHHARIDQTWMPRVAHAFDVGTTPAADPRLEALGYQDGG